MTYEADSEWTLEEAERKHVAIVLVEEDGNISRAARRLGIYRSSLQRMMKRLGITVTPAPSGVLSHP